MRYKKLKQKKRERRLALFKKLKRAKTKKFHRIKKKKIVDNNSDERRERRREKRREKRRDKSKKRYEFFGGDIPVMSDSE